MDHSDFKADMHNGLLMVQLNRPEKMNALTLSGIDALHQLFVSAGNRDDIRCVLISGRGRAFCAGRDLSTAEPGEDAQLLLQKHINPMVKALYECQKPTISAVNGVAMGVGLGLATACDIVIAARSAKFSSPFGKLGAALDTGGHFFLPQRIGAGRSLEMIYTANQVGGERAADWGLANMCVDDEALQNTAIALGHKIAHGPATSFRLQKALLRRAVTGAGLDEILIAEAEVQGQLSKTADYAEGLLAFKEKRVARFQ